MSAANGNNPHCFVRQWWPMCGFAGLCAAWLVWCFHDGLAGIFCIPLSCAAVPAVLASLPNRRRLTGVWFCPFREDVESTERPESGAPGKGGSNCL